MSRAIVRAVSRKSLRTAFALNFLIAFIAFLVPIARGGGLMCLAGDFNSQQIPFVMHGIDMIKSGQTGFDYSIDLGSGFIGAMAFYILGTPFFWIASLFPSEAFMYLIGWFYVLKYAIAGTTSYAYFTRYSSARAALAGSMFYAFSGFMNENLLFYHFHDVVMLFPLLLITLDDLVEKKRRGPFILAVALNAAVNYYFLIGEVVFLALYYFIKYFIPDRKKYGKMFFSVLGEGILGCAAVCILLLPAFLFVIQNPRVKMDYTGSNSLVFSGQRYLFIIKGLLFIGEVMSDHTAVIDRNFSSCAAYLPLVGIVLAVAYCIRHKKTWLTRMLGVCLVFACIPILNAALSAFAGLYCRWYYIPVLFMALASCVMIDEVFTGDRASGAAVDKAAIFTLVLTISFICFLVFVKWSDSTPSLIYRPVLFAVYSAVSVAGTGAAWFLMRFKSKPQFLPFFLTVCLFAALTTAGVVISYQLEHGYPAGDHYEEIRLSENLSVPAGYRLDTNNNMLTIAHGYPGTGNFCSTVSGSIFRFYDALELERDVKSPDAPEGMAELVSARYSVEETRLAEREEEAVSETESDDRLLRIMTGKYWEMKEYEDPDIPQIGFTYDSYMTLSELKDVAKDVKSVYMLRALVIPDEEEEAVSERLEHFIPSENEALTTDDITELSRAHLRGQSSSFVSDSDGFACTIEADKDTYVFFSIPNDSGWTAFVNGKETAILDICGLMAVQADRGTNRIEFRYETPGLAEGRIITLSAIVISLIYAAAGLVITLTASSKRRRKKSEEV